MKKARQRGLTKQFSYLTVEACPRMEDGREVTTILTSSLRALFGELEPHSCTIREVQPLKQLQQQQPSSTSNFIRIKCSSDSVQQIRAALTMVTPPPYLNTTLYRFDVKQVTSCDDDE